MHRGETQDLEVGPGCLAGLLL